ncbi:MAG: hypothetical protein QM666_08840, partial [Acinetobacter sp.]
LNSELQFNSLSHPFKFGSNMVDSFEFYDLNPILIEQKNHQHPFVTSTQHELQFIDLNSDFLQKFDHVFYW